MCSRWQGLHAVWLSEIPASTHVCGVFTSMGLVCASEYMDANVIEVCTHVNYAHTDLCMWVMHVHDLFVYACM